MWRAAPTHGSAFSRIMGDAGSQLLQFFLGDVIFGTHLFSLVSETAELCLLDGREALRLFHLIREAD